MMIPINYDKVKELYLFKSPDKIEKFIKANTYTIQPLIDIHKQIPKYFEKIKNINLDVYAAPESPNDVELVVSILLDTDVEVDDAFNQLDEFDSWFLNLPYEARVAICVMPEW